MPPDGGFARLVREGTWAKSLRYPYAVTDTAPGHASLHTGKVPAESGIFGNEIPWGTHRTTFLRDAKTKVVTSRGVKDAAGSSAERLFVDTVADRLRAAHPEALVLSISVKDRGAILPGGKRPTAVLWYDTPAGAFVTSTSFADSLPAWARLGDASAVAKARETPWTIGDRAWIEKHAKTADEGPGEGDLDGMGTTFPHPAKTNATFRPLPASDAMIVDLALAGIDAEYEEGRPTLVLLSFSAHDVVGHVFGPDSWEAWDLLYKLDATLARLFRALDAKVKSYSVLLAGDHGNLSVPELQPRATGPCAAKADDLERPLCTPGVRLMPATIRLELLAEIEKALGKGDFLLGIADPYVFLTKEGRALEGERRQKLDRAIVHHLKSKPGVAEVYDVQDLRKECPSLLASARKAPDRAHGGEDLKTLVCRSFPPAADAGDYYVAVGPGSFWDAEYAPGKGMNHGSPWLYERTVPFFVRAEGIDAKRTIDAPVDFTAYATIEAALLGLDGASPRALLDRATAR